MQQRAVGELDIVQQNLLSQTNNEKPLYLHVEFVGISSDGQHLVSVDRREAQPAGSAVRGTSHLKFWEYSHKTKAFMLSTQCDEPHKGVVTSVCFDAESHQLCTTGEDGVFKIWGCRTRALHKRIAQTVQGGRSTVWGCIHEGSYCQQQASACQFSQDGSVLAIGFHSVLTLWSSDNNFALLSSAPHQPCTAPITHLRFLGHHPSLVVASSAAILVWDLLSMAPSHTFQVKHVACLMSHPTRSAFAAVVTLDHNTQHLILWEENNFASPSVSWVIPEGTVVRAGSFVAPQDDTLQLLLLTDSQQLLQYSSAHVAPPSTESLPKEERTNFEGLFGISAKRSKTVQSQSSAIRSRAKDPNVFGGISSHMLPSMGTLYTSLIAGLLPAAPKTSSEPPIAQHKHPAPVTNTTQTLLEPLTEEQLGAALADSSQVLCDFFASGFNDKKRKRPVVKLF